MLAACELAPKLNGVNLRRSQYLRFMAASKVLGEETVSGTNGTSGQGADGKVGGT